MSKNFSEDFFDQLTLYNLFPSADEEEQPERPEDAEPEQAAEPVRRSRTEKRSRKKEKILAEIGHDSDKERKTRRVQLLLKESTYNAIKTAADERGTTVNALIGDVIDYLFKG